MDTYEPVAFISVETSDDFILSFFVTQPNDPMDGRSIILMRDRKWEHLIPDGERRVKVTDENRHDDEWQDNFLEQIQLDESRMELKSTLFERKLDLSRLESSDLKAIRKLLKKMNFDKRFDLEII